MDFKPKQVLCQTIIKVKPPALGLEIKDKHGVEYHDGDVVECYFKIADMKYPMYGVIRYFCGRFEIVCPWKDQRFVLGLNRDHESIGHIYEETSKLVIKNQESKHFKKDGGVACA